MAIFGSIWPTLGLTKLSLNSRVVMYTLYFFIHSLNTQQTALSSTVCYTKMDQTCHCINENSKEVQCLLKDLNNGCEQEARKSFKFFCEVMSQFDCRIKYSVKWNCSDCLVSCVIQLYPCWASDCIFD